MKKNNYDYIISELAYRLASSAALYTGPYLEISSNLLFNNQAPFTLNQLVTFTSEVKNIPLGYTVKANTHEITYPIMVMPDNGSAVTLTGSPVTVIFSTVGDTFVVSVTVTLEHATDPDIVITSTFTITAVGSIYFGSRVVDNDFTLPGLTSTVALELNQKVYFAPAVNNYLYFVFPSGTNPPLFFRDQNGLVIDADTNNFTITSFGGYTYMVLNWNTTVPQFCKWELVYTY